MNVEQLQLFEDQTIRTAWDEENEEWYFSIVDVVGVLTDATNPRRYWSDLKRKLKSEGAVQLYENIVQLKLRSLDGKRYATDVSTYERKGYSREWINQRLQAISARKELTKAWSGMTTRQYKTFKGQCIYYARTNFRNKWRINIFCNRGKCCTCLPLFV